MIIIVIVLLVIIIFLLLFLKFKCKNIRTYKTTFDMFQDLENLSSDIKDINKKLNTWLLTNNKNPEVDTVKYIKKVVEDLGNFYDKINF